MGTGYTRNDTSNNIADGNVINASDFDGEFNAIESAMGTSGHTHDGTAAEGGPITVAGPAQDLVVSGTEVKPKTDNTLDLGTASLQFKNAYFQGTIDTDGIMTAATFEPDGDTAAGDNAAIGYTAAEGLILTGQGSTNDVTIKNDADADVITIATGTTVVGIPGSLDVEGDIDVNGTTNLDVVDIDGAVDFASTTAHAGNATFADNAKAIFGAGSDLQIYHDGSDSYIDDAGAGALAIRSNSINLQKYTGETMAVFTADGAVELRYDNAAKLATASGGVSITGNATFADDGKAIFGAGSDLQIYHDGSNSYVADAGDGDLILRGSTGIKLQSASGALEYLSTNSSTGAVELKLSGATKLATTSTGIDVTGIITTDGMTTSAVIKAPDGSAAAPAYTNFGDADGGMYFPSANQVSFASGGVQRLNINNQGDISFYEDTGTTPKLFWDSSAESLGIGTSLPDKAIHVKTAVNNTAVVRIESTATDSYPTLSLKNDAREYQLTAHGPLGDKFTIYDGTAGSHRLVIDSSGNVQIGDTSPENILHVKGAANTSTTVQIESATSGYSPKILFDGIVGSAADNLLGEVGASWDTHTNKVAAIRFESGSDTTNKDDGLISFWTSDAGSILDERMRIDSSGNVGIGTDSPNLHGWTKAVTLDTSSNGGYEIGQSGTKYGAFALQGDGRVQLTNFTANPLTFQTNNTERMRIDSSGNLGIGTSSGVRKLEIAGNNNGGAKANYIRITDTDTSATAGNQQGGIEFYTSDSGNENVTASIENLYAGTGAGSELTFNTAPNGSSGVSEGFRLDENGNLLVGATAESNWETVAGFRTRPSGSTTITRSASPVLYANRLTSHGDIMEFRKDGTAVGSIGSSSSQMYIGYSDTGIRFTASADDIRPWNPSTGVIRDGAIDLGDSAGRFKDLYLSGGIQFDSRSNKLDDYEEGTFTATLSSGATTTPTTDGTYTKIGNRVYISLNAFFNSITVNGTALQITGLPFTNNGEGVDAFASCSQRVNFDSSKIQYWNLSNGTTTLNLKQATSNTNSVSNVLSEASGTYTPTFGNINFHYTT